MLYPATVSDSSELQQILLLQKENLKQHVNNSEKQSQGFLTVEHTIDLLQQMHNLAPSIVVKDGEQLAGYALTMPTACKDLIPDLVSMFAHFNSLSWNGKPLSEFKYYAMGQICVRKSYRAQGVFDMLYQHHKEVYQDQFDFIITEISTSNPRSIRAHERVGFTFIDTFRDQIDEWAVVLWDWN
jgi:ribosomal protein S18 acetylase RimI-like enzyme